jgi:hypothetical protein
MTWKTWLRGLAVAAVGGAAAGVVNAAGNGQLNKSTGISAGVGALTTAIAYLLKSPMDAATQTQTATTGSSEKTAAE